MKLKNLDKAYQLQLRLKAVNKQRESLEVRVRRDGDSAATIEVNGVNGELKFDLHRYLEFVKAEATALKQELKDLGAVL